MSERSIVDKLFESRRLSEAEFHSGGSTYKSAFGNYWKDGQKIDRDEYFKAKGVEPSGSSESHKSKSDNPSDSLDRGSVSSYAEKAGSKMKEDKNGPYFYDSGNKELFTSVVGDMSKDFTKKYPDAKEYTVSRMQSCYYDEKSGEALVVKNSDLAGKSWVQLKKLSKDEVSKLKPKDTGTIQKNEVSEEDYQKVLDRVTNDKGKIAYSKADDDDLVVLTNKGDSRAQEELIVRYEKLVRHVAKGMFLPGGEQEDLVQEGLLGLVSAMKDYKPGKNKDFKQFAILAAKRNMLDAIDKANTQKNSPLNKADDYETTMADTPTHNKNNPETSVLQKADKERLTSYMKDNMTTWELQVLGYYLQGYSYDEIADMTDKNNKSINNAMTSVRSKLRKYKELYKESTLIESILESIESNNIQRMRESYKILFN